MGAIVDDKNELILNVFLIVLISLSILVRIAIRLKSRLALGPDDGWISISAILFYIALSLQIWCKWPLQACRK